MGSGKSPEFSLKSAEMCRKVPEAYSSSFDIYWSFIQIFSKN